MNFSFRGPSGIRFSKAWDNNPPIKTVIPANPEYIMSVVKGVSD
jgi:hypothetical protein